MKDKILYGAVFIIFISVIPAFAEEKPLITTADSIYHNGDTIVISGNVGTVIGGTPVIIQILHDGELIDAEQLSVAQGGGFVTTVLAEGPRWTNSGEYTVRMSYHKTSTDHHFAYMTKADASRTSDNFEVDIGDQGTFDVKYTITGGKVAGMAVNPDIFGMTVDIKATDEGSIILNLPRKYIGAEDKDGKDVDYIILIGGEWAPYTESSKQTDSRVITIDFIGGESGIDIIGTYVLPEFGAVAMAILAVSVVAVIAISKSRLQIRA